MSWFLSLAALGWWSCSTAVLLLSFVAALLHRMRHRGPGIASRQTGLTAVVPVKDLHFGFAEAQQSLFSQNYEPLEVLIVSAEPDSPALSATTQVRQRFPEVPSRTIISHCRSAASPKLNNMWPAIFHAENDLVLTKDSNVVLRPGDVAALVECIGADVGLVSAIPIATDPMTFAAWIEASIINCYHARVLMLGAAVGLGFGLGKIMLFRRTDLMRAGGFDCLKWALGEDMAIARAMRQSGLRTVLARRVCHQILGPRSLTEVWQRQLRWMTIWRVQLPAAFLADFLGSAIPTGLAGAAAAPLIGVSPAAALAGTLIAWFGIEFILCVAKRWPISFWSPLAFLAREFFTVALWLRAWMSSEVSWAGTKYRVRGREEPPAPKAANAFAAREKSE
jgi:ceramide glucosyltransferase